MLITLMLASVVVVACGDDSGSDGTVQQVPPASSQPPTGGDLPLAGDAGETFLSGIGPGISVEEALASTLDEQLLVNGFVFVLADGSVVLADAMAESFPPQPAGAQISVEGLDLMQIPLTEGPTDTEIAITSWTDYPVQLIGSVIDGVFVGNSVASA
jgi:hypothetical protein